MRSKGFAPLNRNTVGHFQCFIYMELSLFTVFSNAAIIVDTIRDIGILLYFCNQNVFTDSVDGSGFDEKDIALLDRDFI